MVAAHRTLIAVSPPSALETRPRLFAALETAFDAHFVVAGPGATPAALIVVDEDGAPAAALGTELPTFVVHGASDCVADATVRLLAVAGVPVALRGVTLTDRLTSAPTREALGREEVLATAGGSPAWTRSGGRVARHRVQSGLPELSPHQALYGLLSERALTMAALIHFLREVTAERWQPAPLRAAFLFDDPNLRWRNYGYIDFQRLVEHADHHRYHAVMAMIPLDAGRPHGPTARLFGRRPDRLSLILHGNDHVRGELLGPSDPASALTLGAQALRRVGRFERRTGLRVDRVMAPPHGHCSEAMTRALGSLGFDALVALHACPWTPEPPSDPPLACWFPTDVVGGCTVIPRVPLASSRADLALRAYLGHPLIVYGHHEDLAGGLEPLAEAAATVNSLGDVEWMSVGSIARRTANVRMAGDHLSVRAGSRRLQVDPPARAKTVTVTAPDDVLDPAVLTGWSVDGGAVHDFGAPVALGGALDITLRLHGADDRDPSTVPTPPWRPWPKLRRLATEARDRSVPLARRRTA